jgi:outer membrane protein assembly factor BamB
MTTRIWAFAASALLPIVALAGDWAEWRGPERNGVSREKNLVDKFTVKGDKGDNVLWIKKIAGGRSTPIVMKGKVYLNTGTEHRITVPDELVQLQDKVTCYDAATGEIAWEDRFPIFLSDIPNIRIGWASMAGDVETGNVYVHSASGLLRCYDGASGKAKWERSLVEEFGEITGYGGRIHTPIIDENRVIVSFSGVNWGDFKGPPPSHLFLAFDKKDGKLLWMVSTTGPVNETTYSCPVVAVIDGVRQLVFGGADGSVHGINARTGEKIWTFKLSKIGLNSSVVVDGDLVYVSHGQDDVANGGMGRIQCFRAKGKGDITAAAGVWKHDLIKAGYASPCVYDGIAYFIDDGGKLFAFDAKDGRQYWKYNLGRVGKGSPVAADGKLYLMEVNGNIQIVPAGKSKPRALSSVRLWGLTSESEDEIFASPAIADGRVFFTTRDRLICVGDKNKQVTSDPVPPLPAEKPAGTKPTLARMYPFEVTASANSVVDYQVEMFDENGVAVPGDSPITEVKLIGLPGECAFDGNAKSLKIGAVKAPVAGEVTGMASGVPVKARVRVFPALPWKFDFEGAKGPPATWIQSTGRLVPEQMEGATVMKKPVSRGKPGGFFFFGRADMTGYTIQCNVKALQSKTNAAEAAQMSDVGLINQRYSLILRGNTQRLHVESWLAHKERLGNGVPFEWKPDAWYTMKLRVDVKNGQGEIKGKVWPKGQNEPEAWTIAVTDPKPSVSGCPGVFYFSLADAYYDDVEVTENK